MSNVIARVRNQAGAEVQALQWDNPVETRFGWKCNGCGKGDDPYDYDLTLPRDAAFSAADRHATNCRFLLA